MPDLDADVVVIGAGLSGLTAARRLAEAGHSVLVAEARDRVGGRLLSQQVPGTDRVVEMGGQWVGPTQTHVLALLDELRLETFGTYDEGRHLLHWAGRLREYQGRVPRLAAAELVDAAVSQRALERQMRSVPLDAPWQAKDAGRLDGQTFETWIRRHARTPGGRRFWRVITGAVFSADPDEMSALWALFYLRSAGGLDRAIDTGGGAQQDRVVGGSALMADRLAALMGDRVLLGRPATALGQDGTHVRVSTGQGDLVARRAVVALPPPLALRLAMTPRPVDREQMLGRMPMGAVIKTNVVYDTPFWREHGLSGQAASDRHPGSITYDNSLPGLDAGILLAFVEGRHAHRLAAAPAADRHRTVLDGLADMFGPAAKRPAAYLEQDWRAEQWTGGCYGAFAVPTALTRFGTHLRRPFGRVHWAGTETATRWAGYLDGAIEAGERAAQEAHAALARNAAADETARIAQATA